MVESKVQKLLDRQQETLVKAAHSQAERAIGETAVELHMQGAEITKAALIAALLAHAHAHAQQAKSLERIQYEHAARLLGWEAVPAA